MRIVGCGVSLVLLLLGAIGLVTIMVNQYQIDRDINGWKDRAQVSSEPNDMYQYMSNVRSGMERWGMTIGYAELIWQTPDNDMALIYRAVNQHIDQARVLTAMDRSTPEYQTGLDNLRGSIRELDVHAKGYWNVHQGMVFWLGFFLFGVFGALLGQHAYRAS